MAERQAEFSSGGPWWPLLWRVANAKYILHGIYLGHHSLLERQEKQEAIDEANAWSSDQRVMVNGNQNGTPSKKQLRAVIRYSDLGDSP